MAASSLHPAYVSQNMDIGKLYEWLSNFAAHCIDPE